MVRLWHQRLQHKAGGYKLPTDPLWVFALVGPGELKRLPLASEVSAGSHSGIGSHGEPTSTSLPLQFRFDRSNITGNWVETPEGFLHIRATFARTGCQTYRNPDGSQRVEYRPESEVARQDSLLSLGGLPVTLEHPPQLLTPDTARQYQRGASGTQVHYDNGFVHGTVVLTDREAIEAVKRGDATELSVGYRCEYDATPGVAPDGTRYDGVQRAISGNHHAVTRKARAGSEVRLHFDSADGDDQPIVAVSADLIPSFEDTSMATASQPADRTDMKPPAEKASAKPKAKDEDEMDEEMEEEEEMDGYDMSHKKGRKDSVPPAGKTVPWEVYKATVDDLAAAELRFDTLSEQLAELEQLVAERADSAPEPDPELINQLVAERVDVLEKAAELTGKRDRHDGLSNREVMELALEAAEVRIDGLQDRSDEYVAARFDAAYEAAEKVPYEPNAAALLARQLEGITTGPRTDSTGDGIAAAAAEHQQALANAWQATATS